MHRTLFGGQGGEPIERGEASPAAILGVGIEASPVLHRDEHRDRPPIALDEDPLTRRGGVEQGAERPAQVKRGDGSHG